jgi:hypothetical protein
MSILRRSMIYDQLNQLEPELSHVRREQICEWILGANPPDLGAAEVALAIALERRLRPQMVDWNQPTQLKIGMQAYREALSRYVTGYATQPEIPTAPATIPEMQAAPTIPEMQAAPTIPEMPIHKD